MKRGGSDQVPPIARDIQEHRDLSIWFDARTSDELDPGRDYAVVVRSEVVDVEKKANAAGVLVADHRRLLFAVGARQQQSGLRAGRAHHDPALRPPVCRERRRIFNEIEAQHVDKESDGGVVVVDHESHEVEKGHVMWCTANGRHP